MSDLVPLQFHRNNHFQQMMVKHWVVMSQCINTYFRHCLYIYLPHLMHLQMSKCVVEDFHMSDSLHQYMNHQYPVAD